MMYNLKIVSTGEGCGSSCLLVCETLPPDVKLSVDRTTLRLHSMRTIDEIMGFFNNAMHSARGIVVQDILHKNNLLSFEDIKDEINRIYTET
jgi:hypothetical protein